MPQAASCMLIRQPQDIAFPACVQQHSDHAVEPTHEANANAGTPVHARMLQDAPLALTAVQPSCFSSILLRPQAVRLAGIVSTSPFCALHLSGGTTMQCPCFRGCVMCAEPPASRCSCTQRTGPADASYTLPFCASASL